MGIGLFVVHCRSHVHTHHCCRGLARSTLMRLQTRVSWCATPCPSTWSRLVSTLVTQRSCSRRVVSRTTSRRRCLPHSCQSSFTSLFLSLSLSLSLSPSLLLPFFDIIFFEYSADKPFHFPLPYRLYKPFICVRFCNPSISYLVRTADELSPCYSVDCFLPRSAFVTGHTSLPPPASPALPLLLLLPCPRCLSFSLSLSLSLSSTLSIVHHSPILPPQLVSS